MLWLHAMENLLSRITIDADICHGKPVIRRMRYPAQTILELLSAGMSFVEILEDYPDLERENLRVVLAYAAKLTEVKHLYSLT